MQLWSRLGSRTLWSRGGRQSFCCKPPPKSLFEVIKHVHRLPLSDRMQIHRSKLDFYRFPIGFINQFQIGFLMVVIRVTWRTAEGAEENGSPKRPDLIFELLLEPGRIVLMRKRGLDDGSVAPSLHVIGIHLRNFEPIQ